jgi:NAD(P)-dependent dehydrogenase (short-subunit alcohol dehydrogenase family)
MMTFLITGASRGIGLELSLFALESGHRVLALVRDPHQARTLTHAKKQFGENLQIIPCDITDTTALLAAVQKANEILGPDAIDILVNNAGVLLDDEETFSQLPIEKVTLTMTVNAIAAFAVTQGFLPKLKTSSSPKLINITSKLGSIGENTSGGYYAYRMSKAALNMFTKSFAADHPEIVSLMISPGWVRTDMGGPQAPLLPRESARALYKVITEATKEDSGRFLDHQGQPVPY